MRHSRIRFLRQSYGCPLPVLWPAVVRVGKLDVSPLCPASGCSARRRLPSHGSLGPQFPTFTGTRRRYDCHPVPLGALRWSLAIPSPLPASSVRVSRFRLVARWKPPGDARAFGPSVPLFRHLNKETGGSPQFPSAPSDDMPRSQTPVVSWKLALACPGLLPSAAWNESAWPSR
jgi:hypothetical protein